MVRSEHCPLTALLKRINRVEVRLWPGEKGQRSVYGYRHFVQALLVRKLLWKRLSSEQIAVVMSGRGTEETEETEAMFLGGTEIVFRAGEDRNAQESPASGMVAAWRRLQLIPGVELHLRSDLPKLGVAELKELLARLETALRENFY